ncbi:MAG: GNAT family N-acetyltransferase [Alphaproteobacteria bacterium]
MTVRTPNFEDAEQIARVHLETWQVVYKNLMPADFLEKRKFGPEKVLRWQENLKNYFSGNGNIIFVSENSNKKITGILVGNRNEEGMYEVCCLYVHPDYQGQGFGRELLLAFTEHIKGERFMLYMLRGNPSEAFYLKMGGKQIRTDKKFERENVSLDQDMFIFEGKNG